MGFENFEHPQRQADDTQVITRLLINGKIEGPPNRNKIVKLPGYANSVTGRSKSGGGNIQFDKVFIFKDPRHGYATQKTFFAIWSNKMYWWSGTEWHEVEWNGIEACNFDEIRFWYDRDELHISGGDEGRAAVYKHLDRDPGVGTGYFYNSRGFTGFWFGPEELPQFNLRDRTIKDGTEYMSLVGNWGENIDESLAHYLMAVYNCEGQEGIYKEKSYIFIGPGTATGNGFSVEFTVDFKNLDKRVTSIDVYGAIGMMSGGAPIDVVELDKQDEISLDWKFLKRISINEDTVWLETDSDSGEYTDDDTIKTYTTKEPKFDFKDDALNDDYYLAARKSSDDVWIVSKITDVKDFYISGYTYFDTEDPIFEAGNTYFLKIISRWEKVTGEEYRNRILWIDDDSLGDPYDTIQAYSIIGEKFPEVKFSVNQDRRTYRLDGKYLRWSEPDKPCVAPNGNLMIMNIEPGEEERGLAIVGGALLAFYEKGVHYIRMTGEPVTYDAEEGKWKDGCIASRGLVNFNEIAIWPSIDGFKIFGLERGEKEKGVAGDLTENVLRDDYKSLIASEYSGNDSSYEGIVGAYSGKQNLVVWTFPNSTFTIGDLTVKLLAYDILKGGFLFLESDKTFKHLFEGYDGELYGVDDDGIYELFADSPDESNRLVWESGIIIPEMGEILLERLRLVYKGTPTVSLYADRGATAVLSETLTAKTSVGQEDRFVMVQAKELQIKIESPLSTDGQEIGKIETAEKILGLI